jgi:hypothetical protein
MIRFDERLKPSGARVALPFVEKPVIKVLLVLYVQSKFSE